MRYSRKRPRAGRDGRGSSRLRLRRLVRHLQTNFADDTCNLYHNNGDGTFSDVTFLVGIGINNQYVAWGCGFIDVDNDGWQDIVAD